MAIVNRLCVTNRIQATATVLTASSSATGSPVARLKDQLRSKTLRSATGWTITTSVNDIIDFNRGGVKIAYLPAGTYATSAAYCAAIVAGLEAADATPVWACTYNATTHLFTISSDYAFTLLFGTGANLARSAHIDLGFQTADRGSATSHEGLSASYQSRHAINADLGAAASVTAAIVINHNAGAGGTFTFQADAASLAAVGYLDTSTPDFSQVLAGDANIRIAFFSDPNRQYLRLLINDVQNSLGYGEVGIWFAGPYTEPVKGFAQGWGKVPESLNEVTVAISGAHFLDLKTERPVWTPIRWNARTATTRDALMAAFDAVPKGSNFFFTFDAVDNPTTTTEYVWLSEAVSYENTNGQLFAVNVPALMGALG